MQTPDLTISDVMNDDAKNLKNIYNRTLLNADDCDEHLTALGNCQYYTESEYISLLHQKKISDCSSFTFISLNIANILSKLSSLKTFVDNISIASTKPSVICVTETHLTESRNQGYSQSDHHNLLPGYNFYHNDRKNMKGGGVGVFVSEELSESASVESVFFEEEKFEGITLTLPDFPLENGKKNLIILTVYRQPGEANIHEFHSILERWLEHYDQRSNEIIITGDMNLDLLRYEVHAGTSNYLDLLISHNLLPVITIPTRIKHRSATLIDHIFARTQYSLTGVLASELSGSHGYTDHYPIFCVIDKTKTVTSVKQTYTKKYFTNEGNKQRQNALRHENWDDVYAATDANLAFNLFQDKYCKIYNDCITTKVCVNARNRQP